MPSPRAYHLLAFALLAACARSRSGDAVARDTTGRFDSVAAVAAATMDDAAVLGLLDAVNAADSGAGALAAAHGRSTDVKDFGRMVVREHHALRRDVVALAARLGLALTSPRVPPDAPPAAMLQALESDTSASWDARYMQYAIAIHRSALENTARALAATQRPEIRAYVGTLVPIVQKHLDKAESLERALTKRVASGTKR